MTPSKLHVLQHAIGADQYGRRRSDRNHFVASEGHHDWADLLELVAAGLMQRRPGGQLTGGGDIFHVMSEGMHAVAQHSPAPPQLSAGQKRYREFLRRADSSMTFGEWLKAKGCRRV